MPDLRFAVETRNVLLRSATWLLQGALPERIRGRARWSLAPAVERARSLAAGAIPLRIEGIGRLTGGMDSLRAVAIRADEDALVVVSRVQGSASIELWEW